MSVNRFIFLVLMMLYLWAEPVPQQQWALVAMGCGLVVTIGLFAHILWRPGANPVRRVIAFCADLSTIGLMMYFTGEAGAIFYPLLLWTVLGNGFRFGIAWLVGSGVVAVILFAGVVFVTPVWHANPYLAVGMAVGLVIIPGYAAVLIRRLNDARRVAEQANAAKTMFLATVSHQLRTPLNAVRGAQDALLGGSLTPDQREMVGIARAGADILLSNIEELIDFAQIESGHLRANPVTFELLPLLGEVINIARTMAHQKSLRFALHVDARCPLRLHGERRYLREILQNLLANAVKFTQHSGVLVAVRPLEITDTSCRVECEVIDSGIGIAAEALEQIFESFTQANERILDEFGGTGLGLAICRRLASALSGSIGVTSVLGEGSRFRIDARFELPPAQSKPESTGEPQHDRVLDGSSGGSFAARLKRTAPDQARAVEFVGDARADAPAVAILSSPDALRSREPEDATERMQQRCLEAGMDACMTKPIDAQRLLATIEQFIASPSADLAPGSREPASVARLTRGGDREASLDEERLRELEALGGTGFLREMLSTLMTEVETLTIDLQRAQGQNDLFLFRDVAHSIRSCAANLGAEPLARQAERLEYLPAETFARQGAADLNALVEQATRLRHDIGRRLAH